MNMNMNKKAIKIAVLLATSLLIAGVSAATYYTMFINATVGFGENLVTFNQGADFGSSTMVAGNQSVSLAVNGDKGAITIVSDPLRIINGDSVSHSINLIMDTWNGNDNTGLNYIEITVYDSVSGGSPIGDTIHLAPSGGSTLTQTGPITINPTSVPNNAFRVQWTIYFKADASSTVTVNLKLDVT
jgi:hypothetical protein